MKAFRDLEPSEVAAWAARIETAFAEKNEALNQSNDRLASLAQQLTERFGREAVEKERAWTARLEELEARVAALNEELRQAVDEINKRGVLLHQSQVVRGIQAQLIQAQHNCAPEDIRRLVDERERELREEQFQALRLALGKPE